MAQIRCPVREGAQISRYEPALVLADREITYEELEYYVSGARARLQRAGCVGRDRVAIRPGDPWQTVVLLMALLRLKAVACLLWGGPTDSTDMELADCCRAVGAETPGNCDSMIPLYYEGVDAADETLLALDQEATILFENAPNGERRGILHSFGSHYYGARGANHAVRLSSKNRWLSTSQLHTPGGLGALFRCLIGGAALVLPPEGEPLDELVSRFGITHMDLTLLELDALLSRGRLGRFAKVRAMVVTGAEEDPAVLQRARAAGLPVYSGFCVPEVAGGVTTARVDTPPAQQQSCGAALHYREIRISDDHEIMVRGQALFSGYVQNHAVVRPVDSGGWFATGRQGRLESGVYLWVDPRGISGKTP